VRCILTYEILTNPTMLPLDSLTNSSLVTG
jgi:hypothetical protein